MSKNRSRNSLLQAHSKQSHKGSEKDLLQLKKFLMETPLAPIYPFDSKTQEELELLDKNKEELTYPDFQPWSDVRKLTKDKADTEVSKMNNSVYLNKGMFEMPHVSNEYYSARNLIQATLFSSTDNCNEVFKELSQHLAGVYRTRNEVINKIKYDSNNFKLPQRVTLTSLKREAWFKDLGDTKVPLSKISHKIPHGIKNKALVDILCSKSIPLSRAIWFTKCVLYGESLALRKKIQLKLSQNSFQNESTVVETHELQWIQEWTQQVVDYVYRFSREISNVSTQDKKHEVMMKLSFLLTYIESLYIECLMDRDTFLASLLKLLKEGLPLDLEHILQFLIATKSDNDDDNNSMNYGVLINFGQRFLALNLIQIFWLDLIKSQFICKELSEALLLNYFFIDQTPLYDLDGAMTPSSDSYLSSKLKGKIIHQISNIIRYLFKYDSNAFIIPGYWILVGDVLYDILLLNTDAMEDNEVEGIRKQLQLVLYRNESLMLNMKNTQLNIKHPDSHHRSRSFPHNNDPTTNNMFSPVNNPKPQVLDGDIFINRNSDEALRIIDTLDKLKLNEDLAKLIRPNFDTLNNSSSNFDWKVNLHIVILWCVTRYRNKSISSERILMICGFIKHKVLNTHSSKIHSRMKSSFESAVLDILYSITDGNEQDIDLYNLYVLINEFYQYKILTISAYLRKLIASGLFYIAPGETPNLDNGNIRINLSILENLPVLNNKQCDAILKKWSKGSNNFKQSFETGKKVLEKEVIQTVKQNIDHYECDFSYIETLEIGIRYLLINWVTDELKNCLVNHSKLLHIRIDTILNIYNLYCMCDNLTVFFRVVIKSILKNEGKIIILDMDALYMIARFTVKHFKLIKCISGNDSLSIGFEIFRLIISNYKDLATRDADVFDFHDIWQFMSHSIDRDTKIPKEVPPKPKNVPQLIYSKPTVESPMRLNTHNNDHSNVDVIYEDFHNDINELLKKAPPLMNDEEVNSAIISLKLGDGIDSFKRDNGLKRLMIFLLDLCLKAEDRLLEYEAIKMYRLMTNIKIIFHNEDSYHFLECLTFFIQKMADKWSMEDSSNKLKFSALLKKLITNEIYDFNMIFTLIQTNLIISEDEIRSILCDLIFEDNEENNILKSQISLLNIHRMLFCKKNQTKVFDLIAKTITLPDGQLELKNIKFAQKFIDLMKEWCYKNVRLFFERCSVCFNNNQIIDLVNKLLEFDIKIDDINSISEMMKIVNEFNLPFCQILTRLILSQELECLNEEEFKGKLKTIVEHTLVNTHFLFGPDNSYFGELFNLLNWNHKAGIYIILEEMLLNKTQFDYVSDNRQLSINCFFNEATNYKKLDLLPHLANYFKKFSISQVEHIQTRSLLFDEINNYLKQLFVLSNLETKEEITYYQNNHHNLFRAISTFIRVLIVRKNYIVKTMIQGTDSSYMMAENLMKLLNSSYLSNGDERLKILLYDVILILKGSLGQEINGIYQEVTSNNINDNQKNRRGSNSADMRNRSTGGGGGGGGDINNGDNKNGTMDNNTPTRDKNNGSSAPSPLLRQPLSNEDSFIKLSEVATDQESMSHVSQLLDIFTMPEINNINSLRQYVDDSTIASSIMLQKDELETGGDTHNVNGNHLKLINPRRDSVFMSEPFGLLGEKQYESPPLEFKIKSFGILESAETGINDGIINLLLFEAYTTKQNPP